MLTNGPLATVIAPGRTILGKTTIWRKMRHKLSLLTSDRENSSFTGFLRLPTQFDALTGPGIDSVLARRPRQTSLTITVIGCSNGAEAFTIASVLKQRRPGLRFQVHGYDIDPECVRKARSARYSEDDVLRNKAITSEFVEGTFDRDGDVYAVKPEIAARVEFDAGDVLDRRLVDRAAGSDIVFAQNFLFHLTPGLARTALEHIVLIAGPGSALFLDGTDLDVRQRFVRKRRLTPLGYEIERIHEEARWARAVGWPYCYWGLEPFRTYRRDAERRYATIFLIP
jgi:chemotaxis protein methyltransferase CheR